MFVPANTTVLSMYAGFAAGSVAAANAELNSVSVEVLQANMTAAKERLVTYSGSIAKSNYVGIQKSSEQDRLICKFEVAKDEVATFALRVDQKVKKMRRDEKVLPYLLSWIIIIIYFPLGSRKL
jgi:hypothetical protein